MKITDLEVGQFAIVTECFDGRDYVYQLKLIEKSDDRVTVDFFLGGTEQINRIVYSVDEWNIVSMQIVDEVQFRLMLS